MLNVVTLSVIMLSVIMLSVIMLSVAVPMSQCLALYEVRPQPSQVELSCAQLLGRLLALPGLLDQSCKAYQGQIL
jgi:hypothetical protein